MKIEYKCVGVNRNAYVQYFMLLYICCNPNCIYVHIICLIEINNILYAFTLIYIVILQKYIYIYNKIYLTYIYSFNDL